MDDRGIILKFPLAARLRIAQIAERCPALAAVADRLPPEGHHLRVPCERLLAKAFTRILHLPGLTWDEASAALAHDVSPDEFADAELGRLASDAATAERFALWEALWTDEPPATQRVIRYYMALISVLYRLEPEVRAARTA